MHAVGVVYHRVVDEPTGAPRVSVDVQGAIMVAAFRLQHNTPITHLLVRVLPKVRNPKHATAVAIVTNIFRLDDE